MKTLCFTTILFIITILKFSLCQKIENKKYIQANFQNSHQYFIENKGQWDSEILFKSCFKGGNLWVQKSKLFFHLKDFSALKENHGNNSCDTCKNKQHALHVNFKNCNEIKRLEKLSPSEEYYNYFIGNDKSKWASDVHGYKQVILYNLYNGINLRLIQNDEVTKYEYIVAANFSPDQIQLEIAGASDILIGNKGELTIKTPLGNISENKPYAYQIINNKTIEVKCDFELNGNLVSYKLGKYNPEFELIIDPVLVFATYSGSFSDNFGMTATFGHDGSAYSGGTVFGNSYPTPDNGVYNPKTNFSFVENFRYYVASDIFISKYTSDGTKMIWTNFLGGGTEYDGAETVHSLICDKDDNLYGFGATSSFNFPTTTNCFQKTHKGGTTFNALKNGAIFRDNGTDIITFQLSANGKNLNASTYIGGSGNDGINANLYGISDNYNSSDHYDSLTVNYGDQFRGEIMLDSLRNIYIATSSRSTDFPLKNPIVNSLQGQQDGVIIKLNNDLSNLIFSTFVGGKNNDALYSLKLDSAYNIIFCGGTSSNNLNTTPSVFQTNFGGGKADGIIGKINQQNNSLVALTYFGFDDYDQCYIIGSDETNDIYIVGHSLGGKFPNINSTYSNPNSSQIIVKFDPLLTKIKQSTCYGSGKPTKRDISPSAMLVDSCKNVYISGWGANIIQNVEKLEGMPVTNDAFIKTSPNGFDFHLFAIDRDFSKILYGTYLGGNKADEHVDGGTSRFDRKGVVYQSICGGCGGNSDFPTTNNAWSNLNKSKNCNNIVLKFDFQLKTKGIITTVDSTCTENYFKLENHSISADNFYWEFNDGTPNSQDTIILKKYTNPGKYIINLVLKNKYCNDFQKIQKTIDVQTNTISLVKIPTHELCKNDTLNFHLISQSNLKKSIWSYNKSYTPTVAKDTFSFKDFFTTNKTLYYRVEDNKCYQEDSTKIEFNYPKLKLNGKTNVCTNQPSLLNAVISPFNKKYNLIWKSKDKFEILNPLNISITPQNTSSYYGVKLISEDSCIIEDSIKIDRFDPKYQKIEVTSPYDSIFKGENIKFEAFPSDMSYEWVNVENNKSSNYNPILIKPNSSRYYHVIGNDGICNYKDSIYIKVIKDWECNFPYIFVPNAFSPNGDGENEILYVRGRPIYNIEFRIFNRWGENVFTSFNLNSGWDGTYNGQKLSPDVFDYYLIVECLEGEKKLFKGNITLLK